MAKHSSEDVRRGGDFGPDSLECGIREKVREVIQTIVNEELEAALGAGVSTRVEGRQGYRHGTRARTVTTSLGPTAIDMPRARFHGGQDGTRNGGA
jgi:putative transposase